MSKISLKEMLISNNVRLVKQARGLARSENKDKWDTLTETEKDKIAFEKLKTLSQKQ